MNSSLGRNFSSVRLSINISSQFKILPDVLSHKVPELCMSHFVCIPVLFPFSIHLPRCSHVLSLLLSNSSCRATCLLPFIQTSNGLFIVSYELFLFVNSLLVFWKVSFANQMRLQRPVSNHPFLVKPLTRYLYICFVQILVSVHSWHTGLFLLLALRVLSSWCLSLSSLFTFI